MDNIIKILSYIIVCGSVIALAVKFIIWLFKKGKNTEKAEHTVQELCEEVKGLKKALDKIVDTSTDHDYRIKQCEDNIAGNHEKVMLELEKLSKEVQEFRHDNSKIMTKLIETINNVTMKE